MKRLVLAISSLFILAGCGGGGGGTSSNGVYTTSTNGMKLVSNDITPGGTIAEDLTPQGNGENPHLKWSNIPANTDGYMFIMDDPDASNFIHWNFGVDDPNLTEIPRDVSGTANLPQSIFEGLNDDGIHRYVGPYPPVGEKHKYRFCIYGLSTVTNTGIDLTNNAYDNSNFPNDFKTIITGSACFMAYYTGK